MSQDPNTKDYIIIFNQDQDLKSYCDKCFDKYVIVEYKWCKSCQINYLKENFTNWTSGNKQLDYIIQKIQLSINNHKDTIFEWKSYDQFNSIKKLSNTTYLAKWKDGPLLYSYYSKYVRNSANKAIILKYLVNSQNITNEFLNEVSRFFTNIFKHFYYINILF
jgi:hypothetical protein